MRFLGVDHGEKRIGVAVSDSTGTIARPLAVLLHTSRALDAKHVLDLATEHQAEVIVVGESFDEAGNPSRAGRGARRFAESLRSMTRLDVVLWDESLSSKDAREWRAAGGASRKRRRAPIDAVAAAVVLQSYLEAQARPNGGQAA